MKTQCPSVGTYSRFEHEACTRCKPWWRDDRCSAPDTVPVGNLTRKRKCALAKDCRWAQQAPNGVCVPMTYGTLCEHQGGTFNTFDFDET